MNRKIVIRRHDRQANDRFGALLILLLLSLLFTGVGDDLWRVVAAVINTLMLVVAMRSTGLVMASGRLALVALVTVPAVVVIVLFDPDRRPGGIGALAQAAILIAILIAVGGRVASHRHVTRQTLAGALCVYVLIGLVFAWIYGALVAFYEQDALVASMGDADSIYYSFTALTTLGFGDVTSPIEFVRRLTMLEAMVGQIFLVTTVARLVSLFGADSDESLVPDK